MTTPQRWTAAEVRLLRKHYPLRTAREVATLIGNRRTVVQIYQKAALLGLRKDPAFFSNPQSGRLDGVIGMHTRFKPGQTSWNKGKKGWKAGGRSAETRFRKGSIPANQQEVGALRINADGYLDIKVAPGMHQWVRLARYVWTTERGPIPRGHVVRVIGDDPHDCADIRNLQLISMRDNMLLNSVHNLPKPVVEVVRLRAVLQRRINKLTKPQEGATA